MSKFYNEFYTQYRENTSELDSDKNELLKQIKEFGIPLAPLKLDILAATYSVFSSVSFDQDDLEKINSLFEHLIFEVEESLDSKSSKKRIWKNLKKDFNRFSKEIGFYILMIALYALVSVLPVFYLIPIFWSGLSVFNFYKKIKQAKKSEKEFVAKVNKDLEANKELAQSIKCQLSKMRAIDASFEPVIEEKDEAKLLIEKFLIDFPNGINKPDMILALINKLYEINPVSIMEFLSVFNKIAFNLSEKDLYDVVNKLDSNTAFLLMNFNEEIVLNNMEVRDRFISLKERTSANEYLFELVKMGVYLSNREQVLHI